MQRLEIGTRASAFRPGDPVHFHCQSNNNPQPVLCYGPYQIRHAYGVDTLLAQHMTGKGSVITIVDAYGSPTLARDVRAFDRAWGLAAPTLQIIAPYGHHRGDSSWVAETSLDVEWAHALAPDAAIDLVLARTSDDVDLYKTLKYVVEHNLGDVISLSFGENERCIDPDLRAAEHELLLKAASQGITVLAAAGDSGSAQFTCDDKSYVEGVSYPASDPLVTAIGGTTLNADALTGAYHGETAWNETYPYDKASGGGYSSIFAQPAYQTHLVGRSTGRGIPDLSLNASVDGGVLIYQSDLDTGRLMMTIMGGTSVGTPEMAAILADGVQLAHHRLGQINPALYRLGASNAYLALMNDIVSGNNALAIARVHGYHARRGWDAATGWGSPRNAYAFLQALISPAVAPAPPAATAPVLSPTASPATTQRIINDGFYNRRSR
jgi:subtilase family serine protease